MSTCGINFLDKWMAENLPGNATENPVFISDLADQLRLIGRLPVCLSAPKAGVPLREKTGVPIHGL
ncbi:hypothetical protein [Mesorhizobium sp. M1406]|uniref:hypothetical protein n=1 Tax=Mesorhizobium sp. M1406 TaxID=2957099 RepID=UPI003335AE5C